MIFLLLGAAVILFIIVSEETGEASESEMASVLMLPSVQLSGRISLPF